MDKLEKHIYDESNGLHYTLVGDYYLPDLELPEENRSIGRYGRLHREYLKQEHLARYSSLILTVKLWTYLADLNEQAEEQYPQPGRGNHKQRIDLYLVRHGKISRLPGWSF